MQERAHQEEGKQGCFHGDFLLTVGPLAAEDSDLATGEAERVPTFWAGEEAGLAGAVFW
jgi:hypothetical protein